MFVCYDFHFLLYYSHYIEIEVFLMCNPGDIKLMLPGLFSACCTILGLSHASLRITLLLSESFPNEILDQLEGRFIAAGEEVFIGVEYGMVVFE